MELWVAAALWALRSQCRERGDQCSTVINTRHEARKDRLIIVFRSDQDLLAISHQIAARLKAASRNAQRSRFETLQQNSHNSHKRNR